MTTPVGHYTSQLRRPYQGAGLVVFYLATGAFTNAYQSLGVVGNAG